MAELNQQNPTGRFTGLAEGYAKYRPTYPPAALDHVLTRCGLCPGSLVVDVGCGTGISARLLAGRGLRVVGVEPNDDMRRQAEAAPPPAGAVPPEYRKGRAEATGLSDGAADAVVAAQAFHWFDAPAALAEFRRILRPGGWVALLWNERDESDAFTAAYGEVLRREPETAGVEAPRGRAGEPLLTSPLFEQAERRAFTHEQRLDEEGMLGRALSASYAPREPSRVAAFTAGLRDAFRRFQQDGFVVLRYETSVYTARRR